MIEKVYIETSVIGAYFDERTDVVSAAQNYWTRIWWDKLRDNYEIIISGAVTDELSHPDYPHAEKALMLVENIPQISIEKEVKQIVKIYIQNQIMPANPVGGRITSRISIILQM